MNKVTADIPNTIIQYKSGDIFYDSEYKAFYLLSCVDGKFGFIGLRDGHFWSPFQRTMAEAIATKGNLQFYGREMRIAISP